MLPGSLRVRGDFLYKREDIGVFSPWRRWGIRIERLVHLALSRGMGCGSHDWGRGGGGGMKRQCLGLLYC